MPTLRFANPELQGQFLRGLTALPFAAHVAEDGTASCSEAQWPIFNAVAHRVRTAVPVFLLPQADRGKHLDFGGPEACSFCGEAFPDLQRLFGSYVAAICDVCVREFHAELMADPPGSGND